MKKELKRVLAAWMTFCIYLSMINMEAFAEENKMQMQRGQTQTGKVLTEQMLTNEIPDQIATVSGNGEGGEDEENGWDGVTTEDIYESENFKITFLLTGFWDGGYNANIKIENTGDSVIKNWKLGFEYTGNIANIWNAALHSHEDDSYIIKNAGWNQDIAVDGSVVFGLNAKESFQGFPKAYQLLGSREVVRELDYTVAFCVESQWENGCTGCISITNNRDEVIEDWTLEFDYENEFTNVWNGVISFHEGKHYMIRHAGYNCEIASGDTVSIGFLIQEGNPEMVIEKVSLLSSIMQEKEEREREPLKKIGESYIKEASEEDVLYNEETGVYYVKNQAVVSAYLGTDKAVVEKIAAEIGAAIVGYIEISNDYQIEFGENLTYEELEGMIQYLSSFPFICNVSLNYVDYGEPQYYSNDALYNDGATCVKTAEDANGNGRYDDDEWTVTLDGEKPDSWNMINPDGDNWGLEAMKVSRAWDSRDRFQGAVKVGIYDNMFDETHEDLTFEQVLNNPSTITNMHGTHVAGTIGAGFDNHVGISGVATDTKLYAYSVANGVNTVIGEIQVYTALIANDVKVINVSYGYFDKIVFAATMGNKVARNYVSAKADIVSASLKKLIIQGYDFLLVNAAGNGNDKTYVADGREIYGYAIYNSDDDWHKNATKYVGGTDAFYNFYLAGITDEVVKSRILVVGAAGHDTSAGSTTYYAADFSNRGERVDVYAPGVDILSTAPGTLVDFGYISLNGTSMAAPHITGLAALIWQANPSLSATQVKNIILNNPGHSVSDGQAVSFMPDASLCVEKALSAPGGARLYEGDLPSGTLRGKVTDSEGNPMENVTVTLIRTSTGEWNLENYYFTAVTDKEGEYELTLPKGTYEMNVYASINYLPYKTDNIKIVPDEVKYMETSVLFLSWSSMVFGEGKIAGAIYDALSGKAVSGVSVNVRSGWNTTHGPFVAGAFGSSKAQTSNEKGEFEIPLFNGQYAVEIVKDDYVTGYYNMIACIDAEKARQKVVITPVLSEEEYRIVLTWGEGSRDLDAHLTYYQGKNRKMHVYYASKTGTIEGAKTATLDIDNIGGYGPETITLTAGSLLDGSGVFRYSVRNFSDRYESGSKTLSYSDAVVRVYKGNNQIETFYVPENRAGTVWHVFNLDEDGIKSVNYFYHTTTGNGVK